MDSQTICWSYRIALWTVFYTMLPTAVTSALECESHCSVAGSLVLWTESGGSCAIRMPDNPYRQPGNASEGQIVPCQMEIHSNCTGYCNIQLKFNKFHLSECDRNLTNSTSGFEQCDMVDMCEYLVVHERGAALDGGTPDSTVSHFHGKLSGKTFLSKTDKVKLQFCYRSETFTARNIQVEFKVTDPTLGEPFYAGPTSVYVLLGVVVLMVAAVALLTCNRTVRHCLEPRPAK